MRKEIRGEYAFEAQFMQRVTNRDGGMIPMSALQERFDELPSDAPRREFGVTVRPRKNFTTQAVDTAQKLGTHSDWSVIATIVTDWVNFYVVDVWRKRVEFYELIEAAREKYVEFRPTAVFIEDTSSGTPLVQELRRRSAFPIIASRVEGSKESRIAAIAPLFEARKVKLRRNAPWLDLNRGVSACRADAFPLG